jgi:hypothetical protein
MLAVKAIREASRICHSTGPANAINERTGKPSHLCRGARDVQIEYFYGLGILKEASDEAWNKQRVAQGMKPQIVKDP